MTAKANGIKQEATYLQASLKSSVGHIGRTDTTAGASPSATVSTSRTTGTVSVRLTTRVPPRNQSPTT